MGKIIAELLPKHNSGAVCAFNSVSNTLLSVPKKERRNLSPEEKADAARLNAVYLRQRKPLGLTQERLAALCGWGTQGAVNQYLLGKIPLNIEAALKFASALEVDISEFSPRLARLLPESPLQAKEDLAPYSASREPHGQYDDGERQRKWFQILRELEARGMADAGLRLLGNFAAELRRGKRGTPGEKRTGRKRTG